MQNFVPMTRPADPSGVPSADLQYLNVSDAKDRQCMMVLIEKNCFGWALTLWVKRGHQTKLQISNSATNRADSFF